MLTLLVTINGLALLAGIGDASPAPFRVQTRTFDIDYEVNDTAQPLEAVQLWYTLDRGATWHNHGFDDDRQSPIHFQAPSEGLYGFHVVLSNASGASSQPPTPGMAPQLTAFVDFTPPVVQLTKPVITTNNLGDRVVEIRWSAVDANLGDRPIQLYRQQPPSADWVPLVSDPVANTGRYDWRPPSTFSGSVGIMIAATDLGGHRIESERHVIELSSTPPVAMPSATVLSKEPQLPVASRVSGDEARDRAAQLFAEAMGYRTAKDYPRAISRLREVVKIDPQRADAFSEMGSAMSELGDWERSLGAFDVALKLQPAMRSALLGSATVYRARKEYGSAADRLRALLRNYPKDAEGWLSLGDIAVYQGDEILARDAYTRASTVDPLAETTMVEAKKRLAMMAEVSRSKKP